MNASSRRLFILALLLPASVAAQAATDRRLAAMTPESFRAAAATDDDPLEFDAVISTERGYRRGKPAKGTIDSDAYLRAVIDKRSGVARYEVWQDIRYFGPRRSYGTVHYAAGAGIERMPLAIARHGADLCPNAETNGECVLTKTMAFPIDTALLRDVAERYRAGDADGWRFKLKDETGSDVVSTIMPAEAAGLLLAVDDYQAQRTSGRAD